MLKYINKILGGKNLSKFTILPLIIREYNLTFSEFVKNTYVTNSGEIGFFLKVVKSTNQKVVYSVDKLIKEANGEIV